MRAKFRIYLTEDLFAVLSLDLSIPFDQGLVADTKGIGRQERENLVGQKMQELLYLLGNTEEA